MRQPGRDVVREVGGGQHPGLVVDEPEPLDDDQRRARLDLQPGGDLLVGRDDLLAPHDAAQVGPARRHVLVQAGERLDEVLRRLLRGHEGAAALDPDDDALGLQLSQRLPDDGAGDVEGGAQLVVPGQPVPGGQVALAEVGEQDLLQLVVERQRRRPVDRAGHAAHGSG